MTLRQDGNIVYLEGNCPIEQAEALAALLYKQNNLTLELSQCRHMHTAVIQAILKFSPPIQGIPDDEFLRTMVLPALRAPRKSWISE